LLDAGDGGIVAEFADTVDRAANDAVRALDQAIRHAVAQDGSSPPWLIGTVPTYRSLLLIFDPLRVPRARILGVVADQAARVYAQTVAGPAPDSAARSHAETGRDVVIPVCYQGDLAPDLDDVAGLTGLDQAAVVRLHTETEYLVHMIGFLVGYPYMASVPEALRVPRLTRPRLTTPRGAVAIAGELTGIYPLPSPGGWRVLGTTPWPMYDLTWDPPALLRPGDRVRFAAISRAEYDRRLTDPGIPGDLYQRASASASDSVSEARQRGPLLRVIRPGFVTTVQDLGRPGYHRYGVGPGGAMDKFALRVGNRLLGNDEGAAALELAGPGAVLEFLRPTSFVWAAPDGRASVDGRPIPPWSVCAADQGARFEVNALGRGLRGCLCVAGGIGAPLILGSRSTNLAAGFGGPFDRPCRAGDLLDQAGTVSAAHRAAADPEVIEAVYGRLGQPVRRLRMVPGLQANLFGPASLATLYDSVYRVSADSNRMGYRLEGPAVRAAAGHDIVSDGLIEGAIQVPGNGQPVLLGSDHQTTGGYPKPGVIAAADMPLFAQLAPGTAVGFDPIGTDEAIAARLELEHAVGAATGGLISMTIRVDGQPHTVKVDNLR
jgi:KipI family sensor histidine kinase inhibitor